MGRKVKYDYEFKLECVELVVNKHYSWELISKKKEISRSNLRKWISLYKEYGKSGLLPRINQIYSLAFKVKVLKAISENSLSLRQTRLRFNISSDSIIIKWKKDFSNFGLEGLKAKSKGRKSMSNSKGKKRKSEIPLTREEELLLENEALRCEIDFLKKLQALIQAEEKNKNRKS